MQKKCGNREARSPSVHAWKTDGLKMGKVGGYGRAWRMGEAGA